MLGCSFNAVTGERRPAFPALHRGSHATFSVVLGRWAVERLVSALVGFQGKNRACCNTDHCCRPHRKTGFLTENSLGRLYGISWAGGAASMWEEKWTPHLGSQDTLRQRLLHFPLKNPLFSQHPFMLTPCLLMKA